MSFSPVPHTTPGHHLTQRPAGLLLLSLLVACAGGDATAPGTPGSGTPGSGTPVAAAVVVTPADVQLLPGQTTTLSATATASSGAPVAATFAWSSSNPAVASVSGTGLVTAIASGSAVIEARVGAVAGRSTLVVADTVPVSLTITPSDTVRLGVGQTLALAAVARSASGAVVGAPISWESEGPTIASVSAMGVVSAIAPGVTVLRARTGAVSASRPVVVSPPAPTQLATAATRWAVELTWTDNSGGRATYEVQRRTLPDTMFRVVGVTPTGRVRFEDTLAVAADTLVYRVRALASGAASAFAVDTVLAPIPPLHVTVNDLVALLNTQLPSLALPADGRDLGAELAAIVPRLLAHPDVITVLLQQETASAQLVLRDGLSINIVYNKLPTAAELAQGAALRLAQASDPRSPWSMTARGSATAAPAIPGSKSAGVISIGGGAEVLPEIRAILDAGGYSSRILDGSVESMKGYTGLGALYFDTHGTAWREVQRVKVNSLGGMDSVIYGGLKYGLETTTRVTRSDVSLYRGELTRGELTLNLVPVRVGLPELGFDLPAFDAKFAITETFIARYWSLDDAIVVLHSCFGGSGPFTNGECQGACATAKARFYDPTVIRTALLSKGASVVQSFDNYVWPTTSLPTMAYFLDRLVGANRRPPAVDPTRRPFDLALVRSAMAEQGLLSHARPQGPPPNTTFTTAKPDAEIIGAPSIQDIAVIDDAARASASTELLGTFGRSTGTVRIGGREATVTSWTPTAIRVTGPFTGPGAVGDVVVRTPSGLTSNEVPLTEWRGSLTLTTDFDKGGRVVGEVEVQFRADVHRRRLTVEAAPEPQWVSTYISPESSGRVTGSGVIEVTSDGGIVSLAGTKAMRILDKATVDAGGSLDTQAAPTDFGGLVTINTETQQMVFCFSMNGTVKFRREDGGRITAEQDVQGLFVLPALADFQRGVMQCLRLRMNDSYGVASGQRTARLGAGDGFQTTLRWSAFVPTSAPRRETKG